ncbi:MAG: hypothetical protein AB2704_13170, partial [Candidatus Thiodiazotropha taylori]
MSKVIRAILFSIFAAICCKQILADPLAFITNQGDDTLSVINLKSLKLTTTIKVGSKPAGIAVSKDG